MEICSRGKRFANIPLQRRLDTWEKCRQSASPFVGGKPNLIIPELEQGRQETNHSPWVFAIASSPGR